MTAPSVAQPPLDQPVESLLGVGPTRAKEFKRLGVSTLGDLLEYFPRDYQYEAEERTINQLVPGQLQTTRGEVVAVDYVTGRVARFEATLDDGTGKLALAWFNSAFLRRQIHPGDQLQVQGTIKMFRNLPQMAQAKWQKIQGDESLITDSGFRAIYAASGKISSETISDIICDNLESALPHVHEWFAADLLKGRNLIGRRDAYRLVHRPQSLDDAARARRRLVYDELMTMQLGLGIGKKLRDGKLTAPVLRIDKTLDARIRARFPFSLTNAQQNCVWQIVRDLQSGRPMNRLLQGDVGSGKTVVAVYAMLMAVANRLQSALLAPTEVLAEQHYLTLTNILAGSEVKVDLFTSRTRRQSRGKILAGLAKGAVHIAVGTQSLLQNDIEFANLGLVVVDEQHKLGVQQRGALKGKAAAPHYLVMTATPIPRTLALSYFADFEVSNIDELPPGRIPIETRRVRSNQAKSAYDFIRKQIEAGRQAYVVLPKIDDDGTDESKSVVKEFEHLSNGPLKGLRLAVLHGQMSTEEKQATMLAFRKRETDVLVATTVIEVGIDIPNATVMLIGDAERFGLSQLHQLRGRVGRGSEVSYCLLLSDAETETANARLNAMVDTNDGFAIAEMDLQLRGPGQFFGTRQHGLPEFKLADLSQEMDLLQQARTDAMTILQQDPALKAPHHQHLRAALRSQIGDSFRLHRLDSRIASEALQISIWEYDPGPSVLNVGFYFRGHMRNFTVLSLFAAVTAGLAGCAGGGATSMSTTSASANVMKSGGNDVLKLTAPANVKCESKDGMLHFTDGRIETEFWLVSGAKTVDDGIAKIEPQIADEFKDFKAEKTMDVMVAGSAAKQQIGKGHEADDGDPGDADVIVFKVGGNIFIGCNHGEELTDAGQKELMMLVQTAQKP